MTTVVGTYFTLEELYADLKVDNIMSEEYFGIDKFNYFGMQYADKKQYDKSIAWFLLGATKNDSCGCSNMGESYHYGLGVPVNYLCALKWYLKSARLGHVPAWFKFIGIIFEHGQGMPRDKYKALEWYSYADMDEDKRRLNTHGIYLSAIDENKTLEQLIQETEAMLEAEKKKLKNKQFKTRKDIETLEQLNIACKLADNDVSLRWDNVYILMSEDNQSDTESVDESIINYQGKILELKSQIQKLEQEKVACEDQTRQHQLLSHKKANLEFQVKGKDREIYLLQHEKTTFENRIKIKDNKISLLERENQELKMKLSLKSKNDTVEASQEASGMVQILNRLLESKSNEMELLKETTTYRLEKEKTKNNALKREIELLKQGRSSQQTVIQSTRSMNLAASPVNVSLSCHDDSDDPNNDLNYDSD